MMRTESRPFPEVEQVKREVITVEEMRVMISFENGSLFDVGMGEDFLNGGLIEGRYRAGESRVRLECDNGMRYWERSLGLGLVMDEEPVDFWSLWVREKAYYQPGLERREYLFQRVFSVGGMSGVQVHLRLLEGGSLEVWYGGGKVFADFMRSDTGGNWLFWSRMERKANDLEKAMKEREWESLFDLPLTAEVEVRGEIV
jgi:hypothetical protein